MTQRCLTIAALLFAATLLGFSAPAAPKKDKPPGEAVSLSPEQVETNYTRTIEKRTSDILLALDLNDKTKAARIHDALIEQYRALRDWQAANLAKPGTGKGPDERARTERKVLHERFIARLSADLTPEQLEKVKDKLTYNKVKVTYDAYCEIVPNLTAGQKARIMELLKEAREEAMDGTSAEEKAAIFKKYKGRINIYLSSEGHDVGKAYKDWGARLKEQSASKAAQPKVEPLK